MINADELKRLTADLRAAETNTTHERHAMLDRTWGALAEFCVDRADELLAMAEENARMREALKACADDLEDELRNRHQPDLHPVSERRFKRDMDTVRDARAALAAIKAEP